MNTNSKNLVVLFALAIFGIGFTTSCETSDGTAEGDQAQDTVVQEEVVDMNGTDDMEMDDDTVGMTAEEKELYHKLSNIEDSIEYRIQVLENKMESASDEIAEESREQYNETITALKEKKNQVEAQMEKLEEDVDQDWEEFKRETEQLANDVEQWLDKNLN